MVVVDVLAADALLALNVRGTVLTFTVDAFCELLVTRFRVVGTAVAPVFTFRRWELELVLKVVAEAGVCVVSTGSSVAAGTLIRSDVTGIVMKATVAEELLLPALAAMVVGI